MSNKMGDKLGSGFYGLYVWSLRGLFLLYFVYCVLVVILFLDVDEVNLVGL
jgi:heme exporter protein D